jgi:hypothetical protein
MQRDRESKYGFDMQVSAKAMARHGQMDVDRWSTSDAGSARLAERHQQRGVRGYHGLLKSDIDPRHLKWHMEFSELDRKLFGTGGGLSWRVPWQRRRHSRPSIVSMNSG